MLTDRTFHPDEANQGFTVGKLLETGVYAYQPQDHHGPTLYYAAAALQKAAGHTTTAALDGTLLRCTPLVFAVLTVVLAGVGLAKARKAGVDAVWQKKGAILGALLLAAAPVFAFFACDFIQEVLLACFLVGMGVAAVFSKGWWFGLAAGLAIATKETCWLSFAAAAFAWFVADRRKPAHVQATVAVVMAALVAVVFYSSFCSHWKGVYDAFVAAPLSCLHRAAGDAAASTGADWHVHPWWRHFEWLFLSGWRFSALPLLALFAFTFSRKSFLHVYGIVLFAIYSALPYKTPWCDVQLLVPLALAPFAPGARMRIGKRAALGLCALQLAFDAAAFVRMNDAPDDKAIPYNYASASPEVQTLANETRKAMKNPDETDFVAVCLPSEDTWPLPWYLRDLAARTGYWTAFDELEPIAAQATPRTLVVAASDAERAAKLFPKMKRAGTWRIRTGVPATLFVR